MNNLLIDDLKKKKSVIKFFRYVPMLFIIVISVFIISICVYLLHNNLENIVFDLKESLISSRINQEKEIVNRVFDLSNTIYSTLKEYNSSNEFEIFLKNISKQDKKNLFIISYDKKDLFNKLPKNIRKNILKLANNPQKIKEYKYKNYHFFIKYNPKLNLIIITKIDTDKQIKFLLQKKEEVKSIINKKLEIFVIVVLVFVVLSGVFMFILTQRIEKIFREYEKSLINMAKKAKSSEKAKAEFLANMSHEIRTPLNAMLGFIQILEEKNLDKETKRFLKIIEISGKDLVTIINDILDFSKIEAGKFKIEEIEFNPKEEFLQLKELFASKASEKNILLEMKENLKYNIISDPTRLKQVIANLLSNAIKFSPSNTKILLNIQYENEKLFVEVIDEGVGIAKDKQKDIFKAFLQADTSTTRKYGGTGLGLTISYRLIELLGGELKVESKEGLGSRFYFSIPVKKGKQISFKKKQSKKLLNKQFNGYILVAEDNKANQMFMKVILNKIGIEFDIVNNGIEALKKFKEFKYDVILMDVNMPKMDGIEATKKIREYEKIYNLQHTPIIALTANAMEGDKEIFIKAGMDYYLTKPLDIEKLEEILEKL